MWDVCCLWIWAGYMSAPLITRPPPPTPCAGAGAYPTNVGITRATPMATPLMVISDRVKIWLH